MRRTIKIKVEFPKEIILPLMKTCSQVFNEHIDWAFANNTCSKTKDKSDINAGMYLT
jgi:hypothetical protein